MNTDKVQSIIDNWNRDPNYVIEMLQDVQSEFRHIPKEALREISEGTGVPRPRLYYITTFYSAFSLKPRGEHEIQVCTGTTCHVKGAQRILDAIERKLGITFGGTTEDLQFSLKNVRCLGCCSLAPVITIDSEIIGGVKSSAVDDILSKKEEEGGEG